MKFFTSTGLTAAWFETPHYTASPVQREILEICNGILYESPASVSDTQTLSLQHNPNHPLTNGTIYVPTPLYYVASDRIEDEIIRIQEALKDFKGKNDLASFFYHPFLEFPYIHLQPDGTVHYEENTPLKRILRSFKNNRKQFVPITSLTPFIPDFREAGILDRTTIKLPKLMLTKIRVRHEQKEALIIRDEAQNIWYKTALQTDMKLRINNGLLYIRPLLAGWPIYPGGIEITGDFNGDGKADAAVWYSELGICEVAEGTDNSLVPAGEWFSDPGFVHWKALAGDFNGDGKCDLFLWDPASGLAAVADSVGSAFSSPTVQHGLSLSGPGVTPCIGDVNGDGVDDLVIWSPGSGTCQVWLGNSQRLFGAGTWYNTGRHTLPSKMSVLLSDVDGDGRDDLILVDQVTRYWSVVFSTGKAFGPQEAQFGPWTEGEEMTPFAGNLTASGRASLLAWSPKHLGGTLDVAINTWDRTMPQGHDIL